MNKWRGESCVFLVVRKVREAVIEFLVLGLVLWFVGVYRIFGHPDDPEEDSDDAFIRYDEVGLGDRIRQHLLEERARRGWPH